MNNNKAKILKNHIFMACIISAMFSHIGFAIEITPSQESINTINYKIRDINVEKTHNETVIIPAKLFQIWKSLTETLNFEVGGGIDFNLFREVERVKMSYGNERTVAFLPDFEISWHTHPALPGLGITRILRPPSAEDVLIAIAGNYNLWLILNNKLGNDYSNALILRAYSEDIKHPNVVDVNLVADLDGIYKYNANEIYWKEIWKDKKSLQNKLGTLKDELQSEINKYFIFAAEKKLSIPETRQALLSIYRDIAHIDIEFFPWDDLIVNGLKIKLHIVELITNQRKQ